MCNKISNFNKLSMLEVIKFIKEDMIIGIGNGPYIHNFIDCLKNFNNVKNKINIIVSSSLYIEKKLKKIGINTIDLNLVDYIDLYIDTVDEINKDMFFIKEDGFNFIKEKIILSMSKKFICITDSKRFVDILGNNILLPIEIIPTFLKYVSNKIKDINGEIKIRKDFKTENGNIILDVNNLNINEPKYLEIYLNSINGIIENGIFSNKKPDLLIISYEDKIVYKENN